MKPVRIILAAIALGVAIAAPAAAHPGPSCWDEVGNLIVDYCEGYSTPTTTATTVPQVTVTTTTPPVTTSTTTAETAVPSTTVPTTAAPTTTRPAMSIGWPTTTAAEVFVPAVSPTTSTLGVILSDGPFPTTVLPGLEVVEIGTPTSVERSEPTPTIATSAVPATAPVEVADTLPRTGVASIVLALGGVLLLCLGVVLVLGARR